MLMTIRALREHQPRLDAEGIAQALGAIWVNMGGGTAPAGTAEHFNPSNAAPPMVDAEKVPNSIAARASQSANWNVFLDDGFVATFLANDPTIFAPETAGAPPATAGAPTPQPAIGGPAGAGAPAATGATAAPAAAAAAAPPAAAPPTAGAPPTAAPSASGAAATPAGPGAAPASTPTTGAAAGGTGASAAGPAASGRSATAATPPTATGAGAPPTGGATGATPAGATAPGAPGSQASAGVPAPPAAGAAAPPAPPQVPRSLALPATARVAKVTPELEKEMFQLKAAREFDSGAAPQQATQQLLAQHADAKLDDASGQLTLPQLPQAGIAGARSLQELSQLLMQQLGVSKVKLELSGKDLKVTVGINPQTYAADLSAPDAIDKAKLQQMAAEARALCARNDAALKAQVMGANPASIGRIIVGSGFAAVANFITLPESERSNTIGVGFGNPWAARGDNLMGQTSEYLRVPGLPDPELFNTANAGGYIPSQAFADSTAMARATSGMAIFPGWAGPVERKEDYELEAQAVTPVNAAPQGAVAPGSPAAAPPAADANVDKRIKPVANADEQMSQKGKVTGPVLVVGGGASAAWNVEKAKKDGSSKVDWLARPAAPVATGSDNPKGELLFKASFASASGGGQRNKLDPATMFVGHLANSTVVPPPPNAKQPEQPKPGAPGSNPEPPQRDADKTKREKWAAPAFALRVPVQTDNGPVMFYTNAVDVTNGPGPARKLSTTPLQDKGGLVEPTTNADGSKTPGSIPPQLDPASAGAAGMLVDPELAKVNVGVVPPPSNRIVGGQPNLLAGGTYNQVVVSIGQDAKAYGSYLRAHCRLQDRARTDEDHLGPCSSGPKTMGASRRSAARRGKP